MTGETRLLRTVASGATRPALGILEKRCRTSDPRRPPVLLVHGATLGAALFDLPSGGYSLMAELAKPGRAVYALDVRGYGHSLGGPVMEAPQGDNAPFARLGEAVVDIGAAVELVLAREGARALDLVGFSWGTLTAGAYASRHAARVARLVLYAPLFAAANTMWLDRIAAPDDRNRLHPNIGAYRLVTHHDLIQRWNGDLPTNDPEIYRESAVPKLVFDTISALDPCAGSRTPPAFRCPSGALADLVEVFNGRPLYDPAGLVMPTLLVRGADDTTATDADARRLLAAIPAAEKHYRVIAPGSHFLCIEKSRFALYEQLDRFLGTGRP